jgi:hypothetical protein
MKNILKNKKLLIGLGVAILLIIAIVVVVLVTNPKSENNEIPNNNVDTNTNTNTPVAMEETHTMYVSINPLVKLVFKEEYTICKDENNQEYVCGGIATDIIDYELINDDAKDIYKDLDFTGKTVEDVLLILCDTARDNDIAFESLEITTDSNNVDSDVLMNYLKENSTYEEEYTVYVNFEEYIDESIIENENTNEDNTDDNNETSTDNSNNTPNDDKNNTSNEKPNNNNNGSNKPATDNTQQEDNDTEVDTPNEDENTSNITSTIDRINLNDNLLVMEEFSSQGCGSYFFAINANEIFGDMLVDNRITSSNYNATDKTNLIYDTQKETSVINQMLSLSNEKNIGISNFKASISDHKITYGFDTLYFVEDYNGLKRELENKQSNLDLKINNILVGHIGISDECGNMPEAPTLLTEELCNKYNLTCDRW